MYFLIDKYYSRRDCVRNTKTRGSNSLKYNNVLLQRCQKQKS